MKNFQYGTLTEFNKIMKTAVDEQIEKAKLYAKKGKYEIPFSDLYKYKGLDYDMFYDMLEEREEISGVTVDNDNEIMRIALAPKFVYAETDKELKEISKKQFESAYAKHLLWLETGDGERADFSGCLIRDMELSGRQLTGMIFDNAKIVSSRLNDADLTGSRFRNAQIIRCSMIDTVANRVCFNGAKIFNCDLTRADFRESDFTKAALWDCVTHNTEMSESRLIGTKFCRVDLDDCFTVDCVYDENDIGSDADGLKLEQ